LAEYGIGWRKTCESHFDCRLFEFRGSRDGGKGAERFMNIPLKRFAWQLFHFYENEMAVYFRNKCSYRTLQSLQLIPHIKQLQSRGSAVGIETGYGLDGGRVGVRVSVESRIVFTALRPALGPTQPPIQWVLGAKRPVREADPSPPTGAEVQKTWIYTSTPPYVFMA
jgi:hypothetical protein